LLKWRKDPQTRTKKRVEGLFRCERERCRTAQRAIRANAGNAQDDKKKDVPDHPKAWAEKQASSIMSRGEHSSAIKKRSKQEKKGRALGPTEKHLQRLTQRNWQRGAGRACAKKGRFFCKKKHANGDFANWQEKTGWAPSRVRIWKCRGKITRLVGVCI